MAQVWLQLSLPSTMRHFYSIFRAFSMQRLAKQISEQVMFQKGEPEQQRGPGQLLWDRWGGLAADGFIAAGCA